MRKHWFDIGLVVFLCTAVGCGDESGRAPKGRGKLPQPGELPNSPQYRDALAQAKAEGKDVFVEFSTSWCGYCTKMKHETFENVDVQARLARYVNLFVDAEKDRDLREYFGVTGYPTYFVVKADGKAVKRGDGYQSPSAFLAWLSRN